MISAKDEFFIEREHIQELQNLAYYANLDSHETEEIFNNLDGITEQGFEQLKRQLLDRQLSPLDRVRNGETILVKDIIKAVKQAVKNE